MVAGSLSEDAEIDLRLAVTRLWARRWWIVTSLVVFTTGFAAAAFLMTPVYRASSVLVAAGLDKNGMGSLGSTLGQLNGIASLAGVNLGTGDMQVQEALAVLQSRQFTEGFIRDEKLLPELFHDRWDSAAGRWKGEQSRWPTLPQAFRFFDSSIRTVTRDKTTGLVTLQIDWRDPAKAAAWANALVARINAEMRTRALASAAASVEYLEKELSTTQEVETRRAISRLLETQINKRMLANVTQEYAFRVVDRALPPEPRDVARPNRLLLLIAGPVLGLLFGVVTVLTVAALAPTERRHPT